MQKENSVRLAHVSSEETVIACVITESAMSILERPSHRIHDNRLVDVNTDRIVITECATSRLAKRSITFGSKARVCEQRLPFYGTYYAKSEDRC